MKVGEGQRKAALVTCQDILHLLSFGGDRGTKEKWYQFLTHRRDRETDMDECKS